MANRAGTSKSFPALVIGVLLFGIGLLLCLMASALEGLSRLLPAVSVSHYPMAALQLGCVLLWAGIGMAALDLLLLLPRKRTARSVAIDYPANAFLTVVLTAYDDELSIGQCVSEFKAHPLVRRVIVVDNNSADATANAAREAGAVVVHEPRQGYGHCVYRALSEGLACGDTELTLLCEGDMTFRAYDVDKFLAYLPHAEIVNGTRIVEQLRDRDTQLTTFMYYGNFFVGKLLEAKHIGRGTFTDVGTTYKLCRNAALSRLLPLLNPAVNLEFNCHFLDVALQNDFRILECPITFHNRVGVSKGGNASDLRALKVGMRMILGVLFGWRRNR